MLKQMCLNFLLLLALASGGASPGDAMNPTNLYSPPTDAALMQQQQQLKQQQLHKQGSGGAPNPYGSPTPSGAQQQQTLTPAHQPVISGSGGHNIGDHRSSYNLLSEAMSQAVSNEFSSGGSADGACHADDLDCYSGNVQDRLGMEAIATLHRQLDDDDNGNIDLSESDDFLREELKYDSGYEKRQKAFHFNDDMHISVKELWEAWLRSEVHNWTIEQTTDWLAQSVQLPQYVELFKIHKVTGAALPRLAVNNMHYVSSVLGIKDPIHKQKIALKAMDVVLFGPPRETGTRWKDYILVTLVLSVIIGVWYAYQQNKNAKRHLRRMAQDMEGLQRAEQSLQEMQKELERARMEQENVATEKLDLERRLKETPSLTSSSSDLEVQQLKKEIEMLRTELSRAEIELVDNCWAPPPQLQSWLQYTYELESKNHLKKRVSAEKQLQSAREACEKLRKKRTSLVGAFVSTHGKSLDDVDRSIVEARNSLGEVTNELQERLHRWKQIESCLGLNIVNNNGLPYLESVLYGRNGGGSSTGTIGSVKGSRGRMTSSTDDLDDESVQVKYCDPKARTWYQWKSTKHHRSADHINSTISSTLNTSNNNNNNSSSHSINSLEDTSISDSARPSVLRAIRKWSSSIAPRVNNPAHRHHRPCNQPHQAPMPAAVARQPLADAAIASTLANHASHQAAGHHPMSESTTARTHSRSPSPPPQPDWYPHHSHHYRHPEATSIPCSSLPACRATVCNRCMPPGHTTSMELGLEPPPPPPPHLRPLERRHTVIPNWSSTTQSPPPEATAPARTAATSQTRPVSMEVLRSANVDCDSLSASHHHRQRHHPQPQPAARTSMHSSHSSGCLAKVSESRQHGGEGPNDTLASGAVAWNAEPLMQRGKAHPQSPLKLSDSFSSTSSSNASSTMSTSVGSSLDAVSSSASLVSLAACQQ